MIANRAPLRRFVRIRMKLYLGKEVLAAITPPHRAALETASAPERLQRGSGVCAHHAAAPGNVGSGGRTHHDLGRLQRGRGGRRTAPGSAPRIRGGKSAMMTAWQRRIIEGVSETADVQRVG